jgi:hypothetical protein
MKSGQMSNENPAFIRKYILQIGVNQEIKRSVLPSGSKDYVDRKREPNPDYYSDRYKSQTISSNDLTTVPLDVITITDPKQITAKISDPKSGKKVNINKSVIEIVNLSEETYSQIKTGASIFLRAGYAQDGDDLPHVFIGQITKVVTAPRYTEVVTTIEANSCEVVRKGAFIHKSYPSGSTLKNIVDDLAAAVGKSGIPVGSINTLPIASTLLQKAYPSGYMVTGSPLQALESVCSANGMKAYVSMGRLFVEPQEACGQLTKVVTVGDGQFKGKLKIVKDKKGEELTNDDDFKDNGDLQLNLFLDGNITKDARVRVTARGIEGDYVIKDLTHTLDWKKGDWDTDVTLLLIKNGVDPRAQTDRETEQ